jgi:hypothetical protein
LTGTTAQIAFNLLTASIAAWVAATLALGRFRSEKVWERKIDAYTAILHDLHNMLRWYDEHWSEKALGRDMLDAERQKLQEEFQKGEADLLLRLDRDAWLISPKSSDRLAEMKRDLEVTESEDYDFPSHIERGGWAITEAQKDLRVLARADLGLDRSGWTRRIADWCRRDPPRFPDLP